LGGQRLGFDEATMLIFYCAPGSSSMATHIALHEVGAVFEHRWLSFNAKAQRSSDYLALNQEGKVPALVLDDGQVLTEVAATLYYLAKTYPAAGLWPAGGFEQEAQAISWMSFIAATVHPSRRAGEEAWRTVFHLCEKRLAGKEWVVGGRYSLADIHLFRLFWRFVDALHPPASDYPGMMAHYERMMAREAVKKTIAIERTIGYEFPRGAGTR
jgi:glutathione S-transferase